RKTPLASWFSSWSWRRRKLGEDCKVKTSCQKSFRVSNSKTESKSRPKPNPPLDSRRHPKSAIAGTLLHKTRQLLHTRIGKALESRFAERVKMEPELLAYHYEQAGLPAPAVNYWHLAAPRAAERSANIQALNHFNRALHLLKELPKGLERNILELQSACLRTALSSNSQYGREPLDSPGSHHPTAGLKAQ